MTDSSEPGFEPTFEARRLAQMKRWAAETTVEQRLDWLAQALKFAHDSGVDYLAQKRRLHGIADDSLGH